MYDAYCKFHKAYYSNYSYNPSLIITNEKLKNTALIKYANESLIKSIRKMEDSYKDENYKVKKIMNRELKWTNCVNADAHFISDVSIFCGVWAGLLSTYLVYYFTNR
jgi:hypothetical protein